MLADSEFHQFILERPYLECFAFGFSGRRKVKVIPCSSEMSSSGVRVIITPDGELIWRPGARLLAGWRCGLA